MSEEETMWCDNDEKLYPGDHGFVIRQRPAGKAERLIIRGKPGRSSRTNERILEGELGEGAEALGVGEVRALNRKGDRAMIEIMTGHERRLALAELGHPDMLQGSADPSDRIHPGPRGVDPHHNWRAELSFVAGVDIEDGTPWRQALDQIANLRMYANLLETRLQKAAEQFAAIEKDLAPCMNVYTCTEFPGRWPVGTSAVIVAPDPERAREILWEALTDRGLSLSPKQLAELTLEPVNQKNPGAIILQDGDY